MSKLIPQIIEENEFVKYRKARNKPKNYKGNLSSLRQKRIRMLEKKHRLTLEMKQCRKMTTFEREEIFKNLYNLSVDIQHINKEIAKIQLAMQNNNQWNDPDFCPEN